MLFTEPKYSKMFEGFLKKLTSPSSVTAYWYGIYIDIFNGSNVRVDCRLKPIVVIV